MQPPSYCAAIVFLLLVISPISPALAERRVALVVGNASYQHTPSLTNPLNDAADIAEALRKLNFHVIEGRDLDKRGMDGSIRQFARELMGADVGVLFYAGHGLQVDGQNFLVPIDAKLEDATGLEFETTRLDAVHKTMERATKTNLIFLDACRDNPLTRNLARALGTRSASIGRGLAVVESGEGTLISFSTQPGSAAMDGEGRNSPYAAALVRRLASPKDDISSILIGVRNDVMRETRRRQVPWEHSALTERFYFAKPTVVVPSAELAFWAAVKDSKDPRLIQSYLEAFPDGTFAPLARAVLARLKAEEAQQQAAVETARKAEEARLAAEAETKRKAESEARSRIASRPQERAATLPTPTQPAQSDPATQRLLARGRSLLERGDLGPARAYLQRAADAGLGEAAIMLAETYDPETLPRFGFVGVSADPERAKQWYRRARELGVTAAEDRLRRLGDR
jgi:hypothetical protein